MKTPPQPDFDVFAPQFIGALFDPHDRVVLAQLCPDGTWLNIPLVRDNAIAWLIANPDTPNLYFRASAHDGSTHYGATNCVQTRAMFVDIDYGKVGHKRPCPFETLDDVIGYLLTCPLRPSIAWHTGHGVQAAYLLREPCVFGFRDATVEPITRYLDIGRKLVALMMADSAFTPEHAYRVPLTINHKPDTAPVRGSVLWFNPSVTYTFDQLGRACADYGIDDLLRNDDSTAVPAPDPDLRTVAYDALPEPIRDEIEGGGERSERLFGIVGHLVRAGYSDPTILDAVRHGADFVDKYDSRSGGLAGEVQTCIDKIRSGRYVYRSDVAPPLRIYNVPVPVRLADCTTMAPALDAMLDRYASAARITLLGRVRNAARFHEHLFATHTSGVIESPCGAGKSVWALCSMAVHAADLNRYLYVTETVEALYRAADLLERLTVTPVGRLHGFNAKLCTALCGQTHTWRECDPRNPRSVCQTCAARDQCAFHDRPNQLIRPIVCMTHSGLIRAMEDASALLDDANVVIDEGLSPFDTWQVSVPELERLQRFVPDDISRFFRFTSMEGRSDLLQWGIPDGADVFARRQYVYRDENTTSALQPVYDALRTRLGIGLRLTGRSPAGELERATGTLAELLSFFRPNRYGDAAYAYHEARDDHEWMLTVKRSRFSFATERRYRRLWILNASAELTPHPYPDRMAVYRCPDLPPNGHLVTLHVVRANPTKTRQQEIQRVSRIVMLLGPHIRRHRRILLAADKNATAVSDIENAVRTQCGQDADILVLRRGTIKGVNHAGDCTLAYLGSMATFTGIDDCALHACLQLRRTFADRPYVYSERGSPNWPGGRMLIPEMRNYYALRSLDEIYQTIWRSAVRNDHPVEAIIAVPDEYWITTLWRTVMPGLHIESAYHEHEQVETFTVAGQTGEVRWDFEQDNRLFGLRIIEMEPGLEITKQQVACELGYAEWERNKAAIMALLDPFFEPGSTIRVLRRKP